MTDVQQVARPLMTVAAPAPIEFQPRGGGGTKVRKPSRDRQGVRLDGKFAELERLLDGSSEAAVTDIMPDGDPELVVVFEVVESTSDLTEAFIKVGLEPLIDLEGDVDDDQLGEDFARTSPALAGVDPIKRFLHASFANEQAVSEILRLWRHWKTGKRMLRGYGPFTGLFNMLLDVRPWGPIDRVRATGLASLLSASVEAGFENVPINIELWYRSSAENRALAEASVVNAVAQLGGEVHRRAQRAEIGYHALAAQLPTDSLQAMGDGTNLELLGEIELFRTPEILFIRPGGQGFTTDLDDDLEAAQGEQEGGVDLGPPLLALLDGLPAANHQLLRGRLEIHDPDDIGSDATYTVERRRHGTMVASAAVWGDLTRNELPSSRRVVVRPVMRPDLQTQRNDEIIPWDDLPADVTIRAIRELLGDDGTRGAAETVKVVNVSLGDSLGMFDTTPSAWARAIDWLASKYNILFVVSAGNHASPISLPLDELTAAQGPDRDSVTRRAMAQVSAQRRLLPPAESLNALTVGSISSDGTESEFEPGYRIDLWGSEGYPAVTSAHGRGIRRAIKPDLAAPGGRQLFDTVVGQSNVVVPSRSGHALPPGVKVAAPPDRIAFTSGTTFAAVEASRRACRIVEVLQDLGVDDRYQAVSAKALLVHGTEYPSDTQLGVATDRVVGHGPVSRDLAAGCLSNQASLLFVGEIGARQSVEIDVPFPTELASIRDVRRMTMTLGWMSPINWNHRQYRRAKLTVDGPTEMPSGTRSRVGPEYKVTRRGTIEHRVLETDRAFGADALTLSVNCADQAGSFTGSIPFALAVSLEVGAGVGVDVYELVRQRIEARTRVTVRQ